MLRRSSHSVWECRYHVVWATKRRKRALKEEHEREYCKRLLRRAAEVADAEVEAIEVAEDHVHLCVEIPPKQSVGGTVRKLKSLSARYMLKRFPYLRGIFWTDEMWSPSYFVRSVGDRVTAAMVMQYIETHEERVALGPVQAELFTKGPKGPKGKAKRRT